MYVCFGQKFVFYKKNSLFLDFLIRSVLVHFSKLWRKFHICFVLIAFLYSFLH